MLLEYKKFITFLILLVLLCNLLKVEGIYESVHLITMYNVSPQLSVYK